MAMCDELGTQVDVGLFGQNGKPIGAGLMSW